MDTNQQGMTIKEIAEITNVSDATVRGWMKSAEIAGLSAKTADAQETKKDALFDLAEVIAIIRAGGRNTLANLLADNTARQAKKKTSGLPEEGMFLELIGIIRSQAAVIENLTGEIQTLRRLDKSRAVVLLPDRSDGTEEWINTTQLSFNVLSA